MTSPHYARKQAGTVKLEEAAGRKSGLCDAAPDIRCDAGGHDEQIEICAITTKLAGIENDVRILLKLCAFGKPDVN